MMDLAQLDDALSAAREYLLAQRCPEGHWEGHLASSALSTATAVSAFCLANLPDDREHIARGVRWLVENQNADGGWGDTADSPSNLSTSLLALSALRLAEKAVVESLDDAVAAQARADAYVTQLAGSTPGERAESVKAIYGEDRTFAVPILCNCALAGLADWSDIPGLPYELAALPQGLYKAVRLQVVSYALPALIAVGMLLDSRHPRVNPVTRCLRRASRTRVIEKIRSIQPESGGFLEAAPLTAFVTMSLVPVLGAEEPVVRKALGFLRNTVREDGSWPIDTNLAIWVTTGALNALAIDPPADGPNLAPARRWVARRQYGEVHPFTGADPGGWGWTDLSGSVPDADDTSGALLALAGTGHDEALASGVTWLLDLQNTDFDQSCPDITAHALRALRASASTSKRVSAATSRGIAYLHRCQQANGSWLPLWFGNQAAPGKHNPVLGTARVLLGLAELEREGESAAKGVQYLIRAQNADGGWGGADQVASSVEETAVGVSALSAWPAAANPCIRDGVSYLVGRLEDGTWTQPAPIGLYFASLWYWERLYPVIWTVEALARARRALA